MESKVENEFVAVKAEGYFTEWYSPLFKDPYEDNEEYRKFYNEVILEKQPVIGPSLGESEDENISGDLVCLGERMTCECGFDDWVGERDNFMAEVKAALADGKVHTYCVKDTDNKIKITPYKAEDMPPINENHIKVYGKFEKLIRERYAAVCGKSPKGNGGMTTSALIAALNESLALNGDIPVNVIFDGRIDTAPELNVADGIVYIEGVSEKG